jgi:hypothetical protein
METFFLGVFVALGPSVAAFAWLIRYSVVSDSSNGEERNEHNEFGTWFLFRSGSSINELPRDEEQAVIQLTDVRLGRHRRFRTALHRVTH